MQVNQQQFGQEKCEGIAQKQEAHFLSAAYKKT